MKRIIQISCLVFLAQAIPGMADPLHKPEVDAGETFQPYVYARVGYVDNLFLLSGPAEARAVTGSSEMSDILIRKGLGLRMALPISLQMLRLDAAIERVDYMEFENLDHYEGHATLALDGRSGVSWTASSATVTGVAPPAFPSSSNRWPTCATCM